MSVMYLELNTWQSTFPKKYDTFTGGDFKCRRMALYWKKDTGFVLIQTNMIKSFLFVFHLFISTYLNIWKSVCEIV